MAEKKKRKEYKRANGGGTVYKLPGRRRKPWCARITTGWETYTDAEGNEKLRQVRPVIGYFESETEAKEALLLNKIYPVSPRADITLEQLYTEWSETAYTPEKLSPKTVRTYKIAWSFLEPLYKKKFNDLRTAHFQRIIDNATKKDGVTRVSWSMLHQIKTLMGLLYKYAIQEDIGTKNYAQFIRLPEKPKAKREIFSDLELKILWEHYETVPWVDTILILIYTGHRIGEMTGLTKFQVDIDNWLIYGGNKTEAGKEKIVPILEEIRPLVEHYYNLDNGTEYLLARNGKRIREDYFRRHIYYPTLEKLGIRKLNPHSTRHTFCTLLDRFGVNPKLMQELAGHENYAFTENTYVHPDLEQLREAIRQISPKKHGII